MALKTETGSGKNTEFCKLVIDEDMTIYAIDELKNQISLELDKHKSFEVDLSGIEEFDSSGIQLLVALRKELIQKNKSFYISGMSNSVIKLINIYGLAKLFGTGGSA